MTTGLVLGKFAPLHKGHQLLIETALKENDRVLVLIYDAPDVTTVPLPVRAGWIEALFPAVEVIQAWGGPLEVGNSPELRRRHEEYLLATLGGRQVDNFYSSEFYGEHVSAVLEAQDRRVDPERRRVPVSATDIRENPYDNRHYLEPVVYRDLVIKVVLLGAPATGKTTLARKLAKAHGTVWVPEYGREYWKKHQRQRRLSLEQLVEVAEGHRAREEELVLQADGVLFVDTDATTTYQFSLEYHGRADPRLAELAAETRSRYDLFFLCGDDIPYDDTWDRSGEGQRRVMQARTESDLLQRKVPFLSLPAELDQRVAEVATILADFDRHRSLGDHLRRKNPILRQSETMTRSH